MRDLALLSCGEGLRAIEALFGALMRTWEAAIMVLLDTGNPSVMWGDSGLLHAIADRLGRPHNAWATEARILSALSRAPGILRKRYAAGLRGRAVLAFDLPALPCRDPEWDRVLTREDFPSQILMDYRKP